MQFLMSTGAKEVKNHYNQILRKLVKALPRMSLILQYRPSSPATHTALRAHQLVSEEVISSFTPGPLHGTFG